MGDSFPSPKMFEAPWHRASYDAFLSTRLPELLAERLPLAGYTVIDLPQQHACRVTVELAVNSHTISADYLLPAPDAQGLFHLDPDDDPCLIIPLASEENLEQAAVDCVGEQLYAYTAARLGQAPPEAAWDDALLRAFLPLDAWVTNFLHGVAQVLDTTNWSARTTHLRRLLIPSRRQVVAPGQQGRVDPFETPEGPNIGRVFTVALGAQIREGRLVVVDERPEAGLGHNAAMVPFLEHDDANRLLMGVNMMRQAVVPTNPEPPLVQTGLEPDYHGSDLWCGRNLLTAFVAWGEGSVEDGLILSESCARRLNYPYPAEPGDKLSNRHGTKGVVSQVLPDEQMPHLADGTPVEIIFSFTGLHMRMNFGQVLEAVLGRVARAEGKPALARPFHSPNEAEIRGRLRAAGLLESGMERLRAGKDGPEMPYPSTVGWVYWYRLVHLARSKVRALGAEKQAGEPLADVDVAPHPVLPAWENGQRLGELELSVLRRLGALHIARESLTTRAARSTLEGAPFSVATRKGAIVSPYFFDLSQRLAAAGIAAEVREGRLQLRLVEPTGEDALRLARPLPHPWLGEQTIQQVGAPPRADGEAGLAAPFHALKEANQRLARRLGSRVPERLVQDATAQLESCLSAYLDALLPAGALRFAERQRFSARAVIAPGQGLTLEQVGLPRAIASVLFGVEGAALEEAAAQRWIVVTRSPAVSLTALVAFRPLLVDGSTLYLHPQACALLDADFDGDQVALFLPVSEEAQREAGEKLSVHAHLARDPRLIDAIRPPHEAIWGAAYLSLEEAGRQQIAALLNTAADRISAPFTQAAQVAALEEILTREGPEAAMRTAYALARLGYATASASGASLSPFPRAQSALPPAPSSDERSAWEAYIEACAEAVLSGHAYHDSNLGPQQLSAAVRPRSRRTLHMLVGPRGAVQTAAGQQVIVRHSLAEGRTAEELFATVTPAREGLAKLALEYDQMMAQESAANPDAREAFTVLARARRARRPGIVFARAAASGEADPLTDEETRILLGIDG